MEPSAPRWAPGLLTQAPVSTRALMVTDGSITAVEGGNLSLLLNVSVFALSRNRIADIGEGAFRGLRALQTLLLEHNRIASSSLSSGTFRELRNLRVLALGNNLLESVRGAWFRSTKGLLRLLLNGNRIRSLADGTFVGAGLAGLSYLDLSNNFISSLGEGAFRALPRLREVDLSGNHLARVPAVLAPLTRTILRGPDRSEWSCTCGPQPPATPLSNAPAGSSAPAPATPLSNVPAGSSAPAQAGSLAPTGGGASGPAQSPAVAAHPGLRRSEADCDYKSPNSTLVFKDKANGPSGREVAQVTVLCFAGAVGLMCLTLAILNWRLQRGKAKAPPESPCGRVLGGSPCAQEPRTHFMQGSCTCHLTHESEIKVMSIVGPRKETPLLQENYHPTTQEGGSSPGQPGLPKHSGSMVVINEAGPPARHFQRREGRLRCMEPGEVQPQTLQWNSKRAADISSDTWDGRGPAPASALAEGGLETCLTNELWQPPTEAEEDSFHPHQQRRFTGSSWSKPPRPRERCTQNDVQHHRPLCPGLPGQSQPPDLPPGNSLMCRYILCDQLQDCTNERKSRSREHQESQEDQMQMKGSLKELWPSGDNMGPSARKKTRVRKRVSFHIPDLDQENGLTLLLSDSAEAGALWVQKPVPHDRGAGRRSEKLSEMKLRIHPEKQPDTERCSPKSSQRGKKRAQQKLSKVAEREAAQKKQPRSPVGPEGPLGQPKSSGNGRTLIPIMTNTQISDESHRIPNGAQVMSGVSKSPRECTPHLPAQAPGRGQPEHVSSLTSSGFLTGLSPASSPKQRIESAALPPPSVLSCSSGTGQGAPNGHFKPRHSQADQVAPGTTEDGEHCPPQRILRQEDGDSSTLRNETQSEGDFKLDPKDSSPEEALPFKPQYLHRPQLGTEQETTKGSPRTSSQVAKNGSASGGPNSPNNSISRTESYASSLPLQAPSNSDILFVESDFVPYQNSLEFSNDINTPLPGTQPNWHPPSRSKRGTESANGLPRDDGKDAPREKIGVGENKEAAHRSWANYGAITQAEEMALPSVSEESRGSRKYGKSDPPALLGPSPAIQSSANSNRSPRTKTGLLPNETDPPIYNHTPGKDVQEVQDMRPDEGDDEHGKDVIPAEKHGDAFVLPEVKDCHFEAENEVPLIPSWVNDAENSAADPTPFLPSAEYANPSPLAAEQSEPNNSNNNRFLL
ncbi:leucine-rich repeat-containing protein 53 [Sarcophilus harrisii]